MIKLLDTHLHLLYPDKLSYGWTADIPPLANQAFTIENYDALTKDLGVVGSLFMEVGVDDPHYQKEAHFIADFIGDAGNSLTGMIASCRPEEDEGFDAWLEECNGLGAKGFRRILHVVDDEMSTSTFFRDNIKKIGATGRPFDICFLPKQLGHARELAKACENTTLVLNHCGVPNIAGGELDPWRADMKALAELPNVKCKLSGITAYCGADQNAAEAIMPFVDHALECFGADRMVWGSDWPVVNLGQGVVEWIKITQNILAKLSSDEANAIGHLNAQKIYV